MDIKQVELGSARTLSYLERYVNDGSPSGFSDVYTSSATTAPFGDSPSFTLAELGGVADRVVWRAGSKPDSLAQVGFLLHPDMADDKNFYGYQLTSGPRVTPTASARTVRLVDQGTEFIKLTYRGLIGRIERQLGVRQAKSAIEVSRVILETLREARGLSDYFGFMPENFAEVIELSDERGPYQWGYLVRDAEPFPKRKDAFVIPAFSLFSRDRGSPRDPILLEQFVDASGLKAREFVIDGLIAPLIRAYFELVVRRGLQLEAHAQNVLFGFASDFTPQRVIARDAESVDKDISLMDQMGIEQPFQSLDYKCLVETDYNYQIMHSFMYDFKMGEYLITPLIDWLVSTGENRSLAEDAVRAISSPYIQLLPPDFFPLDCWYYYESVIHDRTKNRPYIASSPVKYR